MFATFLTPRPSQLVVYQFGVENPSLLPRKDTSFSRTRQCRRSTWRGKVLPFPMISFGGPVGERLAKISMKTWRSWTPISTPALQDGFSCFNSICSLLTCTVPIMPFKGTIRKKGQCVKSLFCLQVFVSKNYIFQRISRSGQFGEAAEDLKD